MLAAGGRPVLYDAGLTVDADDLLALVGPSVAAAVVVHIGGHLSVDLPALVAELDRREG